MVSNKWLKDMEHWLDEIESKIQTEESSLSKLRSNRGTPRERILQKTGEIYKNKIQAERERLDKQREQQSPFRPKINKMPPRPGSLDIGDRLINAGHVQDRKKAFLKKRLEQERQERESEPVSPTPKRQQASPMNNDRLYNLYKKQQADRQWKKEKQEEQEKSEMRSPQINSRSKNLARQDKIEDRLTAEGQRLQLVRQSKIVEAEVQSRSVSPNISPVASRISRTGSITERLGRYQQLYDYNKENLKRAEPQYTFQPTINQSSHTRSGRIQALQQPQKVVSKSPTNEGLTFTPKLSKHSVRLAQRMGKSRDRLTRDVSISSNSTPKQEYSFTPKINKYSKALCSGRSKSPNRWEALYEMNQTKLRRRPVETNEPDAECTFTPSISKSTAGLSPSRSAVNVSQHVNKLYAWDNHKQEKVRQIRESEMYKDLEHWTFTPEIHSTVDQDEGVYQRGTAKHIERQNAARRMHEEKTQKQNKFSGQKWLPKRTVPKEFNFKTTNLRRAETPQPNYNSSELDEESFIAAVRNLHSKLHS